MPYILMSAEQEPTVLKVRTARIEGGSKYSPSPKHAASNPLNWCALDIFILPPLSFHIYAYSDIAVMG
jgi:hypothetical protein